MNKLIKDIQNQIKFLNTKISLSNNAMNTMRKTQRDVYQSILDNIEHGAYK